MTDLDDRKLARWRATRDGALYACPHCWNGQREAGRCRHCRRFDVRAFRPEAPRAPRDSDYPGPMPDGLAEVERLFEAARKQKQKPRRDDPIL